MWKVAEEHCVPGIHANSTTFGRPNGHIFKLAAKLNFYEFIRDIIGWKLDLNGVDGYGGDQTLLDYVVEQIKRTTDPTTKRNLVHYQDILSEAGAKRADELPPGFLSAKEARAERSWRKGAERRSLPSHPQLAVINRLGEAPKPGSCRVGTMQEGSHPDHQISPGARRSSVTKSHFLRCRLDSLGGDCCASKAAK